MKSSSHTLATRQPLSFTNIKNGSNQSKMLGWTFGHGNIWFKGSNPKTIISIKYGPYKMYVLWTSFEWMRNGRTPYVWRPARVEDSKLVICPSWSWGKNWKKARRDHKSCDKKTETRFKITSFLTEKHLVHGDSTISCLLSNLPPARDGLSHVALVPWVDRDRQQSSTDE